MKRTTINFILVTLIILGTCFNTNSQALSSKMSLSNSEYLGFLNKLGTAYSEGDLLPTKMADTWEHERSRRYYFYFPKESPGSISAALYYKRRKCTQVSISESMSSVSTKSALGGFTFEQSVKKDWDSKYGKKIYSHYKLINDFSCEKCTNSKKRYSVEMIIKQYYGTLAGEVRYDTDAYLTINGKNKALRKRKKYLGLVKHSLNRMRCPARVN